MAIYDFLTPPGGRPAQPQQIAANPYVGQSNDFMGQLKNQMNSTGGLAEEDYKRRMAEMLQKQLMLQSGRNPGMARQAGYQTGQAQAGIAQGAATAGIQEKYAQQQAYMQALQNAQQNDFQRSNANLQSYWENQKLPTGFDKLMGYGTAIGGIAAKA